MLRCLFGLRPSIQLRVTTAQDEVVAQRDLTLLLADDDRNTHPDPSGLLEVRLGDRVLEDGEAPEREAIYWHYPHYGNQGSAPAGAVRAGDWKLVEWYEDGALELYDLSRDISEAEDLADEHPEKVKELHAKLTAWLKETGARMSSPNPGFDPEKREGR